MSDVPLLSAENLSVEFHARGKIVQTVRKVSWSVRRGETLAILGESGWPELHLHRPRPARGAKVAPARAGQH